MRIVKPLVKKDIKPPQLKQKDKDRLRRIADVLLLNGSFIDNLGLLKGKIGIAIFFYHYSIYTQNKIYEDYAGELIDEICESISNNIPVDFENGLTGIGWGIEYLVKNRFIDAEIDEVLADIDNKICSTMSDLPLLNQGGIDISGFGFYYLARLEGVEKFGENLNKLLNRHNLCNILDAFDSYLVNISHNETDNSTLSIEVTNSIIWFLLEMYKCRLSQPETKKLLMLLSSELKCSIESFNDPVEEFVLCQLLLNIAPQINDNKLEKKFTDYANNLDRKWRVTDAVGNKLVNIFSSLAWHKLIYVPYLKYNNFLPRLSEMAFNIIDNEDNWSNRLDTLTKDNIGLTGLAGLGLGLMNG